MTESHSSLATHDDDLPRFVDKLRSGKAILFRPRGRSMMPAVPDGTVLMIDPAHRAPSLYEVVLARLEGHVVLHRVMHVRGHHIWLMGDAHRHAEGPLPIECVVGIARLEPPKGFLALRMKLRRAWFLLLGKR